MRHYISRLILLASVGLTLGLGAGLSQAAVQLVDCQNGPFTDIQSAVDAATDGDSVAVKPCATAYAPFQLIGKTDVHVTGVLPLNFAADQALPGQINAGPTVAIDGADSFNCMLVENSSQVSISGFQITGCGFHSIEVRSSVNVSITENSITGGVEAIRDQGSVGTRYVGNTIREAIFSIFLDGDEAYVANNQILLDTGSGINVLNSGNHIVNNTIRFGGSHGIVDQADGSRIERNRVIGNGIGVGDSSQILLNSGSSNADVIGNITGNLITDNGTNTDLAGNR